LASKTQFILPALPSSLPQAGKGQEDNSPQYCHPKTAKIPAKIDPSTREELYYQAPHKSADHPYNDISQAAHPFITTGKETGNPTGHGSKNNPTNDTHAAISFFYNTDIWISV
jgi:hypothetical protein